MHAVEFIRTGAATALPFLDDKAVNSTIFKNYLQAFKETYYFTYLFTALSSSACTMSRDSIRSSGTIGHLARLSTECS